MALFVHFGMKLLWAVVIYLFVCFLSTEARRGGGNRKRNDDRRSDSKISMKGSAAELRSANQRSGGQMLSKHERDAVNTILHFHDSHDPDKPVPNWAQKEMHKAQRRNGML